MWRVIQPLHQGGKSMLKQVCLAPHKVLPTNSLADRRDFRLSHARWIPQNEVRLEKS